MQLLPMSLALWAFALRALESHVSVLGGGILLLEKNNFYHDHDGSGVILLILENAQDK